MDELNVSFICHAMNAVHRLGGAEREDVERHVASQANLKQHYQVKNAKALSESSDFHERLAWALELLRIGGLISYHQGLWSARPSGTASVNAGFNEGAARRVMHDVIAENGEIRVPSAPMSADASPAPARAAAPVRLSAPLWARNTILYGPPGTGKTYATIKHAVALAERGELAADDATRDRAAFDRLRAEGRIGFVTFHQSYGYEDFVEGLRPETSNGQIRYEVRPGALRKIVTAALDALRAAPRIPLPPPFDEVWEELIEHGWSASLNESNYSSELLPGFKIRLIERSSASGIADRAEVDRHVFEAIYALGEPRVNDATYSAAIQSIFEGDYPNRKSPMAEEIWRIMKPYSVPQHHVIDASQVPHYVLVIDEINRGNMSRIFGELITLLEPSKRLGLEDALEVELPVSGDTFGVPPNLHILGTMNTADRSIALLDVALRRRFKFMELMPDPSKVHDEQAQRVMKAINERVELLLDREHQLGHALFMGATDEASLVEVLRRDVLPLLKEYFYGDWARIAAVLGCSEAKKTDTNALIYRREVAPGKLSELLSGDEVAVWCERLQGLDAKSAIERIIEGG